MKRALTVFGILAVLLAGCGKADTVKTYEKSENDGILVTYCETEDGTWECNDTVYQFRLELSGRMPNAESDSYYVVLTNHEDLTFEDVSKSLYSSLLEDCEIMRDSIIAEMK